MASENEEMQLYKLMEEHLLENGILRSKVSNVNLLLDVRVN